MKILWFVITNILAIVFYLQSPGWGMENVTVTIPTKNRVEQATVTIPRDIHFALRIQSITVNTQGVITGISLMHKIDDRWVTIQQQVVDDVLIMGSDGFSPRYRVRSQSITAQGWKKPQLRNNALTYRPRRFQLFDNDGNLIDD